MQEKPKRLAPTKEVLRELYLKSGNLCAYPGCHNVMCDEAGNFIGQICHIEAAEEGGERFNPHMTNEERRAAGNLMLMCYEHHVVTNNVAEYPVSRLKQMKKAHEDKFSGIIQKMRNSVVDYGITDTFKESKACQALCTNCSYEENRENSKVLNKLLHRMTDLPIETRTLLGIMASRSFEDWQHDCIVPLHEIAAATGKEESYILCHIEILKRRGLISEPEAYENEGAFCTLYSDAETDWSYWNDIRDFCKRTDIAIDRICVDLDFSVFD